MDTQETKMEESKPVSGSGLPAVNVNIGNPSNQPADTSLVVVPLPNKSRHKLVWIIVLLVIVIAVLATAGFLVFKRKQAKNPANSAAIPSTVTVHIDQGPSLENNSAMLLKNSKIIFPEISSQSTITPETLAALPEQEFPKVFIDAMGADLKSADVRDLTYQDGRTGYLVSYNVSGKLGDAYTAFIKATTPKSVSSSTPPSIVRLNAAYASFFALVELQSGSIQLRFSGGTAKNNEVRETIQTINTSTK